MDENVALSTFFFSLLKRSGHSGKKTGRHFKKVAVTFSSKNQTIFEILNKILKLVTMSLGNFSAQLDFRIIVP